MAVGRGTMAVAAALLVGACGDDGGAGGGTGAQATSTTASGSASATAAESASPGSSSTAAAESTGSSTMAATTSAPTSATSVGAESSSGGSDGALPCGGGSDSLWAWAWAGEAGEHLDLVGDPGEQRIELMRDLSGRGHDYVNTRPGGQPAFQIGFTWNRYHTDLPAVALHRYEGGPEVFEQFMFQDESLDADGGFYLAFAGMNSRDNGERELWGTTMEDVVRLDQSDDRVNAVFDGEGMRLTDDFAIAKGPLLLEIWRDDAGTLTVYANGQDVTVAGAASTSTFHLSGIGHDQTGTSGWDDVAFEYIVCDALPTDAQRDWVRGYLNDKWGLFGA